MSQPSEALRAALAAAERLPRRLQRQLAERLLASDREDVAVSVHIRRLPLDRRTRLEDLMDKNNEVLLTKGEQTELVRLGSQVNDIMLANSIALARAARPELFDKKGRPIRSRFRQAVGKLSGRKESKAETSRK
jgi:hypothetical protein